MVLGAKPRRSTSAEASPLWMGRCILWADTLRAKRERDISSISF